jgi:hypothetical protein
MFLRMLTWQAAVAVVEVLADSPASGCNTEYGGTCSVAVLLQASVLLRAAGLAGGCNNSNA